MTQVRIDGVGQQPVTDAKPNRLTPERLRTVVESAHCGQPTGDCRSGPPERHRTPTQWSGGTGPGYCPVVLGVCRSPGDQASAAAILDRFLHHCEVIAINGPSYRLKDRADLVNTPDEPAP